MSVAVCHAALHHPVLPVASSCFSEMVKPPRPPAVKTEEETDEELEIMEPPSYIHPLVRRSSFLMTQKSLETCTESLGSETGCNEFTESDSLSFKKENGEEEAEEAEELDYIKIEKRDLFYVNYHCSIGRRSQALRSFPPPLTSISRRNGPCFKMTPHRRDGRLVVQAVPIPSVNYLHAERRGGRLVLSFVDSSVPSSIEEDEESTKETEEEEEEEEVEVVDRGTVVEVKVSTQAAVKLRRSSLVINKFVVGSPPSEAAEFTGKRTSFATTTAAAAAAAVAASSMSTLTSTFEGLQFNYLNDRQISRWGPREPQAAAATEAKLLFTSKRRSREELLHDMRWCNELRRPLFIYESNLTAFATS